jgi:putative ABC transport system substrate-binding protein
MKRRQALLLWSLAWPCSRSATAQAVVRRLGVLVPGSVDDPVRHPQALVDGLSERGWVEGQNLHIERRIAGDRLERLPALAKELLAAGVELIVTIGTPAALAARQATETTPIVTATIGDPVGAGLAASLSHPGGNVTGNTFIEPDLGAKRLQMLVELLPQARRIGELMNPDNPSMRLLREGESDTLQRLSREAVWVDVRSASELSAAFGELVRQRAQAVVVHADSLFVSQRQPIAQLALQHRLPMMGEGRRFAEAGALVSYAPSAGAMVRHAASFVDRIFKGARPGELPFERPTTFELVLNRRTAQTLGLALPRQWLLRADEVIG